MRRALRLIPLIPFITMACGGSEGTPLTDPVPDGGGGASEAGVTDSGGPTADGGTDALVLVDGGDGGDAAAKDTRIDPIEVGRTWTYNVTVIGIYPLCSNGIHTATTLSSAPLDGKTGLKVQSLCENAGTFDYAVEGDRVFVHLGGSWKLSLDSPVAANHTWTDGTLNYRWDKLGPITTAAGTFTDCWQATTVAAYTSYIQLCRGVGPVKWHYETGFGNGYEATLTAKNF